MSCDMLRIPSVFFFLRKSSAYIKGKVREKYNYKTIVCCFNAEVFSFNGIFAILCLWPSYQRGKTVKIDKLAQLVTCPNGSKTNTLVTFHSLSLYWYNNITINKITGEYHNWFLYWREVLLIVLWKGKQLIRIWVSSIMTSTMLGCFFCYQYRRVVQWNMWQTVLDHYQILPSLSLYNPNCTVGAIHIWFQSPRFYTVSI